MDTGPARPSHTAHDHRLASPAAFLFGFAINTDPDTCDRATLGRPFQVRAHDHRGCRTLSTTISSRLPRSRGGARVCDRFSALCHKYSANFDRSVDRGEKPTILMDADATDPSAIGNAAAALATLTSALDRDLPPRSGPGQPICRFSSVARSLQPRAAHVMNIAPGLILVVLTMSTLFVTTLSKRASANAARWRTAGNAGQTTRVMLAKVVPTFHRLCQVSSSWVSRHWFSACRSRLDSPIGLTLGSHRTTLRLASLSRRSPAIRCRPRRCAVHALRPSPVRLHVPVQGMPVWAQWVGEVFPMTHALRMPVACC